MEIPIPEFGTSITPVFYFILAALLFFFVYRYMRQGDFALPKLPKLGNGMSTKPGDLPFCINVTRDANEGEVDPVIGREDEIRRAIHILSRRTKNNPLLVGPAGVGKTAIVEGLAFKIATGDIPANLKNKQVLALQVTELLAGTKYRGEFEKRIQQLIGQIKAANRTIILFIDEIHMLIQTKGTEGAVNFTDILKPALARGELQLIGATSLKEYEEYIKPDETLERRFQVITVDEPSVEEAITILMGVKVNYEDYHDVEIEDEAVRDAVRLSAEYITNRKLPDKAIDLIDEASAAVKVRESSAPESAVALLHDASYQARCEFDDCPKELMALKEKLSNLKSQEKERNTKEELNKIRKTMVATVKRIEEIEKDLTKSPGRPKVGSDEIKKVVAQWADVPLKSLH